MLWRVFVRISLKVFSQFEIKVHHLWLKPLQITMRLYLMCLNPPDEVNLSQFLTVLRERKELRETDKSVIQWVIAFKYSSLPHSCRSLNTRKINHSQSRSPPQYKICSLAWQQQETEPFVFVEFVVNPWVLFMANLYIKQQKWWLIIYNICAFVKNPCHLCSMKVHKKALG